MELGAVYPQIELAGDAGALRDYAQAVEKLGLGHLVMYDHVIGTSHEGRNPPPSVYNEKDPFHDPLTAFAYLSGLTERIEFVSAILILPQRQTVLVARQTADVDLMSGGRLRLGVGAGYNPLEYHALGADFSTRGRRLTEQITYLRRLWSEEVISFDGEFDQIDRANIVPRPKRQIPIWCGGFIESAFQRAVRLADGFIFGFGLSDATMDAWVRVQQILEEAGRSTDDFGAQFLLHPPERAYSDQEVTEGLLRLRQAGATHASIFTMGRGFTHLDEHIEYVAHVKAAYEAARS
jgi:probable F420-dependent oxidoreductase